MTIRSTLLGVGAILWIAAAACWFRARGNGRLSREGWLFLVLGVPFLVAGLFFAASSYPQERPAAAPVVTASTPPPEPPAAATPAPAGPSTYAEAVNAAQHAAVARYPELGRAGTDFNTRFVAAYHQLRLDQPNYFTDPDWPLHLADEIARTPPPPP